MSNNNIHGDQEHQRLYSRLSLSRINTQWTFGVKMTSYQRRCDVITSEPSETLRDIRTSTYQICRIEKKTNGTTKFHKWTCNLTPLVRNICWKYCGTGEKLILFSTIFCYLMLDFCVKTRIRFSLRDKRLFEITEVEITRVDCTFISYIGDDKIQKVYIWKKRDNIANITCKYSWLHVLCALHTKNNLVIE